jgi:predicted transcriptional regulator
MNKEVTTAKPEDQLITATNTMLERKIGYVVLVEKQRVVGSDRERFGSAPSPRATQIRRS